MARNTILDFLHFCLGFEQFFVHLISALAMAHFKFKKELLGKIHLNISPVRSDGESRIDLDDRPGISNRSPCLIPESPSASSPFSTERTSVLTPVLNTQIKDHMNTGYLETIHMIGYVAIKYK